MDFREALTIVHALAEKQRMEGDTELPEETVTEALEIIKGRVDVLQKMKDKEVQQKIKGRKKR